jgi:eukaryotic-like serine/threonine-protein kinase
MKGETVAQYLILDKIGEGGMGAVWKARDGKLGRIVALKILSNVDTQSRDRFLLEARSASALNHPGIVTIYEVLEHRGRPCIVMEYIEGRPLDGVIPPGGMPAFELIRTGVQIADALHAAHHAGIIHRDLKPGNVIMMADGRTKLLDFGLAKVIDGASVDGVTQSWSGANTVAGTILGTVNYMSPEQAQGMPVDIRSDIFSLGALLYEMATGRQAFAGETRISTITSILRDDPKPISRESAAVPRELERVIARCLRKDPERRFQTAQDVRNALEDLREEILRDEMTSGSMSAPVIAARQRKSPTWLMWALAGGLVAAGAGVWLLAPGHKPEDRATAPLTVRPLANLPGQKQLPIFSADGNEVVFAWDGGQEGQNSNIYMMQLEGGTPLQITHHSASAWPGAFSPDGRRLYFSRQSGSGFAAYWVPALGGAETWVADGILTDISPDGRSCALVRLSGSDPGQGGIFVRDLETGVERRLGENFGAMDPKFSPDGKWVFVPHGPTRDSLSVHRVPIGGGKLESVPFRNLGDDIDRVVAIELSSRRTRMRLDAREKVTNRRISFIANADGSEPQRLPLSIEPGGLSPDGRQMVSVRNAFVARPYRAEAFPPRGRPAIPQTVSASSNAEYSPRISPDGSGLLLSTFRAGRWEIWKWDIAMTDGRPLFSRVGGTAGSPAWSPDGKWIAFDARTKRAGADIWLVEAAGGEPKMLYDHSGDEVTPCFDPTSQWIYFTSSQTGTLQLFRGLVTGGPPTQVTQGGAFTCQFSPDGHYIYYLKTRQGGEIWRLDLATTREELVVPEMKSRNWKVLRDGIYMMDSQSNSQVGTAARVADARFYRFATRKIEDLGFRTAKTIAYTGIDLSPDGKWVYYSQVDSATSELYLVENLPGKAR